MTPFMYLKLPRLKSKDHEAFDKDSVRQADILLRHGYIAEMDSFIPVFDLKEEKVVAVLCDFGNLIKIK